MSAGEVLLLVGCGKVMYFGALPWNKLYRSFGSTFKDAGNVENAMFETDKDV